MHRPVFSLAQKLIFVAAFGGAVISATLGADSTIEREVRDLADRRDKALAIAAQPINKSYQTALEALLRRATQNKDLDAMAMIVSALKAIDAPTPTQANGIPASYTKQIEDLLFGKTWIHRGLFRYRFSKDGRFFLEGTPRKGHFEIDGKKGLVSFAWDGGTPAGEGMQFNPTASNFTSNQGGDFLPAK